MDALVSLDEYSSSSVILPKHTRWINVDDDKSQFPLPFLLHVVWDNISILLLYMKCCLDHICMIIYMRAS